MPVFCYVGPPRSGKSYRMVKDVIVPAIGEGRTVVSNIDGLNEAEIHKYLVENGHSVEKLGKVVTVTNEEFMAENFLPHSGFKGETVIKGGELICADEAQMFWGFGDHLSKAHLEFLTIHGHYVDPVTERCCDLVLATQDLKLLNRKALGVVDKTFRVMRKDEMGLNSTFVTSVFSGASLTRSNHIQTDLPERYDVRVFKLYKSFSGETGKGVVAGVDRKSNVLNSKKNKYLLVIVVCLALFSFYSIAKFFGGKKPEKETPKLEAGTKKEPAKIVKKESEAPPESNWTLVGYFRYKGLTQAILRRGDQYRTISNPQKYVFDAVNYTGELDGEVVSRYTGGASGKPGLSLGGKL